MLAQGLGLHSFLAFVGVYLLVSFWTIAACCLMWFKIQARYGKYVCIISTSCGAFLLLFIDYRQGVIAGLSDIDAWELVLCHVALALPPMLGGIALLREKYLDNK